MDERWMALGKKRPSRHIEMSDTMHKNGQTCSGPRGAYPTPCHKDHQDSTVISAPMLTGSTHFFTYQLQVGVCLVFAEETIPASGTMFPRYGLSYNQMGHTKPSAQSGRASEDCHVSPGHFTSSMLE